MRLCSRCGRSNEDDAQFCQDCGTALDTTHQAGQVCPACGEINPEGSRFCQHCGVRLTVPDVTAPRTDRLPCPVCGKQTPAGFAFCQYCGSRLPDLGQEAPAVQPTPPAGLPKPTTATWDVVPEPPSHAGTAQAPDETSRMRSVPTTVAGATESSGQVAATKSISLTVMDLLMVERSTYPVEELPFDIGRSEGHLTFPEDPYLSPRHLRIQAQRSGFEVVDLDSLNGVYIRVDKAALVSPGTQFIVGGHLLRLEAVPTWERDLRPVHERGIRLWGTQIPRAWARLTVLSEAGTTLDRFYLTKSEIVIGTGDADVSFPDDPMVSERQAVLSQTGPHITLRDLGSDYGTYVRLDRPLTVRPGTVLRAGLHLIEIDANNLEQRSESK